MVHTRGIALLITLLLMSVLLGISSSLLNITLKQYQFSGIGLSSEQAFQAANAGMECITYWDNNVDSTFPDYPISRFDVNGDSSGTTSESGASHVTCMGSNSDDLVDLGSNSVVSGEEQKFRFSWGTPSVPLCTEVSIFKFYSTTVAQSMNTALRKTSGINDCAIGVVCTVIQSRGYNVACPLGPGTFPLRTIERELTQRY